MRREAPVWGSKDVPHFAWYQPGNTDILNKDLEMAQHISDQPGDRLRSTICWSNYVISQPELNVREESSANHAACAAISCSPGARGRHVDLGERPGPRDRELVSGLAMVGRGETITGCR